MSNTAENTNSSGLTAADIDNLTLKLCRMTDDDLFQSNLISTLKPIILELSKNNENKVKLFELLVHINNRIRAVRTLKMPLEPFFDLFNDTSLYVHSTNMAHMYIKLCFPKYDQETRVRLLPLLFSSLTENKNMSLKDILLHVALPSLAYVKITESNRKQFEMANMPYQRRYIIEFLTLILLTPYNYRSLIKDNCDVNRVPDGMNSLDFSRVIKNDVTAFLVNDDLEKTKCGIVNFLIQRVFPDEEVVLALCIAHSDTRHSVVSLVDRDAKNIYAHIDWDKLDVLNLFLDWFIPRRRSSDPGTDATPTQGRLRLPIAAQNKIGALLMRSKISLPNKLVSSLAEAASVTFLDHGARSIHPKQIETGFALVAQICAYCSDVTDDISQMLLKNLIAFMQKQFDQHDSNLKIKALNLIPQVLKRNHRFLLQDTFYLSQLFDSLCNSNIDPEIREAVKDCLRNIAIIFQNKNVGEDSTASSKLENILYINFNKEEEECRMAVVYFAGLVYSSVHIPTRFLLLEALGDQSKRVREEAEHVFSELFTLSAQHDIVMNNVKLPYFVDLVNYHGHLYNRNLFSDPVKLIPVVEYIRMCILSLDVGLTDVMKRELVYDSVDDYRFRIYRNIQHFVTVQNDGNSDNTDVASAKALEMYCKLVQVIYYTKNYFMNFLEEIIAASPKILPTKEGIILHRTKNLMLSDCQDDLFNRENCASAHALLALETEDDAALENNLKTMLEALPIISAKQLLSQKSIPQPHAYHGNALGFAYLVERLQTRQRKVDTKEMVLTFLKKIEPIINSMVGVAESATTQLFSSSLLLDTLCVLLNCIMALCQCGAVAFLPPGKWTFGSSSSTGDDTWPNKALIGRHCLALIRISNASIRLKEAALHVLAALSMGESNLVHSGSILEHLMQMHSMKDPLLHKLIGQTIVSVIMGTHSPYKGRWYERQFSSATVSGQKLANIKKSVAKDLHVVMGKLYDILAHGNSISRHNAAVWSVFLVQKLGWHSAISLSVLHSRILVVLGDKDEMAQDAASCVLGTIYEHSNAAERKLMSEELIQVILHGQRGRLDVAEGSTDEDKFTDAELEARDTNRATYKELCSLAQELNQPDLVYSFLPLASGQRKWTARGGASIGLSQLLVQHGGELEPRVVAMVPKLFRYRFERQGRTQQAMEQIWTNLGIAVAAPNQELVRKCFPDIVTELRHGLASDTSRVREASCRALRALLKHEAADPLVLTELGELVRLVVRVMDDSRDEGREAALDTARSVEKFCTIILDDPARRQSVEPLLTSLVPVLLEQGLPSTVPHIHQFALTTLASIVHSGRAAIRCAIPGIVIACLQALSSHEATESGYISQQLAGMGSTDSRERWDEQRVQAARQSPVGDILTSCIRYIEDDTQGQLLVPLADIVRHGVGLATRCGTAQFLIDLSLHCGSRLMGATGKLLAALLHAVLDKNEVVQREMAKAIGCLVKYSKKSSVEKLFVITRTWYFDNHDSEEHQLACCHVYHCIEKYASGTLEQHSGRTLPLIFLAKQNEPETGDNSASGGQKKLSLQTENCQKRRMLWSQTWVECVRAEASVVMGMMTPILACVAEALSSSFYHLRTQACLALMCLVRGLGRQWANRNEVSIWAQLHGAILNALVTQAKWWPGKVYLLYATMGFVRQLDENGLLGDIVDGGHDRLIELVMKETTKSDTSYRCVAFETVAKVSDVVDHECVSALLPMISPLVQKGTDSQLIGACEREMLLRVIGHMWPKTTHEHAQEVHFVSVIQLLSQAMDESQWRQQIAVLKSFKSLFKKTAPATMRHLLEADGDQTSSAVKCFKAMLKSWRRVSEMGKYKQLRESCLDTIEILLVNHRDILAPFKDQLRALLLGYGNDSVTSIKDKSATLIKMIS